MERDVALVVAHDPLGNADQAVDLNVDAGLLADLAEQSLTQRLTGLDAAAWERPLSLRRLAIAFHEEERALVEHDRSDGAVDGNGCHGASVSPHVAWWTMAIDWVFLDVGGVLFSDESYFTGLYEAIARVVPDATRDTYDERLRALRSAQEEPFTGALLDAFVADATAQAGVREAADASWAERGHRVGELYPEVLQTLETLAARYKLACITNHFSWVRDRADEAGFGALIGAWAISAEAGVEKPDPALFRKLLGDAGTSPDRVAMVGDRLDRDIVPAKALGMRTIWVLRNEAPDEPTAEQLAVPDAVVRTLDEIPAILERF